jgi:hypothetical protein
MRQINNSFKPDSTIMVVKGFPLKGPYVVSDVKDLTIDMKDTKQDEYNG